VRATGKGSHYVTIPLPARSSWTIVVAWFTQHLPLVFRFVLALLFSVAREDVSPKLGGGGVCDCGGGCGKAALVWLATARLARESEGMHLLRSSLT
jgi:hypothetical protein